MEIVNVTATFVVPEKLVLKRIAKRLGLDWKRKFPCVVYSMGRPKCKLSLYASGKVVIVGLRKTSDVAVAADKMCSKLMQANHYVLPKQLQIRNVVGSMKVNNNLDLSQIYKWLKKNNSLSVTYEIDRFPAVIVSFKNTKTSASIFSTGTIHMTGCKTETELRENMTFLLETLKCSAEMQDKEQERPSITNTIQHRATHFDVSMEKEMESSKVNLQSETMDNMFPTTKEIDDFLETFTEHAQEDNRTLEEIFCDVGDNCIAPTQTYFTDPPDIETPSFADMDRCFELYKGYGICDNEIVKQM